MFRKSPRQGSLPRDFEVRYVKTKTDGRVVISVGQRYVVPNSTRPSFGADRQIDSLPFFYSAIHLKNDFRLPGDLETLKKINRLEEISRYIPHWWNEDTKAIVRGEGRFTIGSAVKTFFWIKVVTGTGVYDDSDYANMAAGRDINLKALNSYRTRLEYGASVPPNSALFRDTRTPIQARYNIHLPIFSVTANGPELKVQYSQMGQIQYASTTYHDGTTNRNQLKFDFSALSKMPP